MCFCSNGTVVIFIRIAFPDLKSVPSESEVLQLANTHLDAPGMLLNRPVMVDNITYEKLSDSSFAITQRFEITDVSISENTELRTETNNLIQDTLNNLLNGILSKPAANPFTFPEANYINTPDQVEARVEYVYKEGDISQPSDFLSAILAGRFGNHCSPSTHRCPCKPTPIPVAPTQPGATTAPATINGTVVIFIRIAFPDLKSVPSESEVLQLANTHLDAPGMLLNRPVMVDNITYEKLSDSSFAITQRFEITDVSISENTELRTETNNLIQDTLNNLLNGILSKPAANPFTFPEANYINTPDQVEARVEYVYKEGDISQPSDFLSAILADLATTVAPTPTGAPASNHPSQ
ncbi:hypothetical protein AGOR_G00193310 [Albula goreensis]|uniref:Uncharacterized protein n=1 Tax=Albula goreensis TaxID=1534307 RepID=A0A8T3CVM7_9TELE|nr:hypothetical protein AGOR_G00193310 [Albula goreensis]